MILKKRNDEETSWRAAQRIQPMSTDWQYTAAKQFATQQQAGCHANGAN